MAQPNASVYGRKGFGLGSQLSQKLRGMQRFLRWSFSHSIRSQLFRMTPAQALEEYWIELRLDPVAISPLGAQAVMLQPHHIAHLIEQFFRLAQGRLDRYNH